MPRDRTHFKQRKMEEEIKKAAKRTKNLFIAFWALAAALAAAGECGGTWTGLYAGCEPLGYWCETAVALSVLVCVPAALKLFSVALNRKIGKMPLPVALRLYERWSAIRLLLLALPVMGGLLAYYALMSATGGLCALIGLVASLFCVPGEKRLRSELKIDEPAE